MTSSTPSPSAQELAAENESHVATHRDGQSDPCDCWLCDLLRRNAAALRRLSETERERGLAVEGEKAAMALCRLQQDIAKAAEAERDRLREMLAQADARLRSAQDALQIARSALDYDVETAAFRIVDQEIAAISRHRLSQKAE